MAQLAPAHGEDSAAEGLDGDAPACGTWVSRVEMRQQELRRLFDLPRNEVRALQASLGAPVGPWDEQRPELLTDALWRLRSWSATSSAARSCGAACSCRGSSSSSSALCASTPSCLASSRR